MLYDSILSNGFPVFYSSMNNNALQIFSTNLTSDEILIMLIFFILFMSILAGFIFVAFLKNKRLNEDLDEKTSDLREAFEVINKNNKKLKIANEELIKKNIRQNEFINTAAHELRTPTQAITGYIELIDVLLKELFSEKVGITLREEGNEKTVLQLSKYQELVMKNATRLSDLINNLLDIARIDLSDNNIRLNKENVDLIKEIRDFLIDYGAFKTMDGNKVGIRINFDDSLISDKTIVVDIDRLRFGQILSNLINNSIKFSNENSSITISIKKHFDKRISTDRIENMIVVSVSDEGKGISSAIMPQIFERFVTDSESGTGLGLYITKKLVEVHGGSIWCYNNENGKGSTFEFTLPISNNS